MPASELHYEVVIRWSDEDRAYLASAPDLPGCMADGSTYSEAMENIERVIREWVETATELGRAIPKPNAGLTKH